MAQPEDQYTYRLEEFEVPEGIGALQVDFDYSGKDSHAEMEIGLYDPMDSAVPAGFLNHPFT